MNTASRPQFTCTSCERTYRWKPELAGKQVKCGCGVKLSVPAEPPPSPDLARSSSSKQAGKPCPECNKTVKTEAAICVHCGYDFETGGRLGSTLVETKAKKPAAPRDPRRPRLIQYEPSVYVHRQCGTETRVSNDIRQKMIVDPYFYADGMSICANCGVVPDRDCEWVETGQQLDEYMKELKQTKGAGYEVVRWGIWVVFVLVAAIITPIVFDGTRTKIETPWDWVIGASIGLVLAETLGRYIRLALCMAKII